MHIYPHTFTVKGKLFLLAGPSNSGKSTVLKILLDLYPNLLRESVSYTTRWPRRPGERERIHYYFVDEPRFKSFEDEGEFLETTLFEGSGFRYGTLAEEIEGHWRDKFDVVLACDTLGVDSYFRLFPDDPPLVVFFDCTDEAELRRRFGNSDRQDSEDQIAGRIAMSHKEREWAMRAQAEGRILYLPDLTIEESVQRTIEYFRLLPRP